MIYTNFYSLANLHTLPKNSSELETQCLFGEKINVISENKSWYFCKLLKDQSKGWIKKKYFTINKSKPNFKVRALKANLYQKPDLKSQNISSLYLNSLLKAQKINENWSILKFKNKDAYIYNNDICKVENHNIKLIDILKSFIGTPYLWGGKSYDGIDCSGLIQISFETQGILLPRNTSKQIKIKNKNFKKISKPEKNCLIFWKNHVGFLFKDNKVIHSSGQKMRVVEENAQKLINNFEQKKLKVLEIYKFKDENN